MDGLYILNSIGDVNEGTIGLTSWYKSYYLNFSLLIFSIGFLFKVSAAPFHFWSPDVYDAIPTIVTTFVAIIAKISIFIFMLELVYHTYNNISEFSWTYALLISSILSLIIGTIVGLTQFRIKRLLAYRWCDRAVGLTIKLRGTSKAFGTKLHMKICKWLK